MSIQHKDKMYVAKVVEIIKDGGTPTFELKVRVPTVHGSHEKGIRDADLPIALPLMAPGTVMNQIAFEAALTADNVVYVVFESGNLTRPLYLGMRSTAAASAAVTEIIPYATETVPGLVRVKVVNQTGYIYTSEYIPE